VERGALAERVGVAATALLDLVLPKCCPACERPLGSGLPGLVCGLCWSRLRLLPHPQCDRCGHPLSRRGICRWCDLLPPFVRAVRSVCWVTDGTGGAIVHALKYEGWHDIADGMAERMARLPWPADVHEERAALIPVPLAASRERERGFNQSERLARAIGERWSLPVWDDCLVRVRTTETQTRLTPGDRLRNVSGAFHASREALLRLRGRHLVLVDDVVTTAATLNACAAALFDAGARIISYITFGRAHAVGDRP
jgi:ComF family protein